jgi:hypothetical protein
MVQLDLNNSRGQLVFFAANKRERARKFLVLPFFVFIRVYSRANLLKTP